MKKRHLGRGVICFILLIISILINFNESNLGLLLLKSVTDYLIFLFVSFLLFNKILFKSKNLKKIKYGIIVSYFITLILIIIFLYIKFFSPKICLDAITPPNFSTNILTGRCIFSPGSGCFIEDPWYYKESCNISIKEKAEILKNKNYWNENVSWLEKITENCSIYCNEKGNYLFCHSENNSKNLCEELEAYR
jgi:hypothetical protein